MATETPRLLGRHSVTYSVSVIVIVIVRVFLASRGMSWQKG